MSDEDLKALFHRLWGESRESPEYDRKAWIKLQRELQERKVRV